MPDPTPASHDDLLVAAEAALQRMADQVTMTAEGQEGLARARADYSTVLAALRAALDTGADTGMDVWERLWAVLNDADTPPGAVGYVRIEDVRAALPERPGSPEDVDRAEALRDAAEQWRDGTGWVRPEDCDSLTPRGIFQWLNARAAKAADPSDSPRSATEAEGRAAAAAATTLKAAAVAALALHHPTEDGSESEAQWWSDWLHDRADALTRPNDEGGGR